MNKIRKVGIRASLVLYDTLIFIAVTTLLFGYYRGGGALSTRGAFIQGAIAFVCIFGARIILNSYRQIWRYGGIQSYIKLLFSDGLGFVAYLIISRVLPIQHITVTKALAMACMNCLLALTIRMVYRYAYKCGGQDTPLGHFLRILIKIFAQNRVVVEKDPASGKIRVAIVGAGNVGVALYEELMSNPQSKYIPRFFIDTDNVKAGSQIHGIDVMNESETTIADLKKHHIQEVILAVPNMDDIEKQRIYDFYKQSGLKFKTYDYPLVETPGAKRTLREIEVEDLLMRPARDLADATVNNFYKDKTILITGGGGSIGSEIVRQLAKMEVKHIVVLDVYENNAYELQQQIKFIYKDKFKFNVEICSVTDRTALDNVFNKYKPDIVIHAAAHKHVPLMEDNPIEAVRNNVFGTLNVVKTCLEYGVKRFMMVSTDKAVNPTNVMGATKRMCEFITNAYANNTDLICTATRFGNVLGSAGSVIPLFKQQIAAGGPVTVTDKRIIRYFMTIPEASQLVLTSGSMASNGELFVLDMGKPVQIYELAKNMIELSGVPNVEIVETGLRPGEKMYEELLVKKDELIKTDNELIFVEHDDVITMDELKAKLEILEIAIDSGDALQAKLALKKVVPTYKDPSEVNVIEA